MTDAELESLAKVIRYLENSPVAVPLDQSVSDLLVPLAASLGFANGNALRDALRDNPSLALSRAVKYIAENSGGGGGGGSGGPASLVFGSNTIIDIFINDANSAPEYVFLPDAAAVTFWGAGVVGWNYYPIGGPSYSQLPGSSVVIPTEMLQSPDLAVRTYDVNLVQINSISKFPLLQSTAPFGWTSDDNGIFVSI